MIGQPFTISKNHPMQGCKTIDGFNFRSQFRDKFKLSPVHDTVGSHKWTLNFHPNIVPNNHYTVESISRTQPGHPTTLRFWNAESRAKGAGYVQLPVYYLSLSRLFPIGESGKTTPVTIDLSQEELEYCETQYYSILSIQQQPGIEPSVGIEKAGSSKTYSGINDDIHDIFTNSAGEGNITRIILAILSFKRLKEQYPRDYKGGILLIDELDATLYPFSQKQLVNYLYQAASDYHIQIVFTTHSPIILKTVNNLQRAERQNHGFNRPEYSYDINIVYLDPQYDDRGNRFILPKNISTNTELSQAIADINLAQVFSGYKLNIYCEDLVASEFVKVLLMQRLSLPNLDSFMTFVDINLGWTNYVQLIQKAVPEFIQNIVILDGDVPSMPEYRNRQTIINNAGNVLFLPLVIEKDLFTMLKDHEVFNHFSSGINLPAFTYDYCFNNWPLSPDRYQTNDFKAWYKQAVDTIGTPNALFDFWISQNEVAADDFAHRFFEYFNRLAIHKEIDTLPPQTTIE